MHGLQKVCEYNSLLCNAVFFRLNVTVQRHYEAAYVKCIKSVSGFERRYSVTEMFCDLGLSTFNAVMRNDLIVV